MVNVDISGVHELPISFCTCQDQRREDLQLLAMGLYPASRTRPRTAFTAELAGLELLEGVRTATGLRTADGHELSGVAAEPVAVGAAVLAAVRPSAVSVGEGGLRAVITDVEQRGDAVRVRSALLTADVPAADAARLDLAPGREAGFTVAPEDLLVYPA